MTDRNRFAERFLVWFRLHPRAVAYGVVAIASALQLVLLLPVFGFGPPTGQDNSIFIAEIAEVARALRAGDFELWLDIGNMGYPFAYFYQGVPQLTAALLVLATGMTPILIFKILTVAVISVVPIATYRGLRTMGIDRTAAAVAAFTTPLVHGASRWGISLDSGFTTGLWTQLWAMAAYPLALGSLYTYLERGRRLLQAVFWTTLVALCHPFVAVALVPPLFLLIGRLTSLRVYFSRLLVVGGITLACGAFFWLPIVVHYENFGGFIRFEGERGIPWQEFLRALVNGALLDRGRDLFGMHTYLPLFSVGLIAALCMMIGRRHVPFRQRFWLEMTVVFAILMMLGPALGKVGEEDLLPAIRFLAMLQFSAAVAVAFGAVHVARVYWPRLPAWPGVRMALAGGALVLFGLVLAGHVRAHKTAGVAPPDLTKELYAVIDALPESKGRVFGAHEFGTGSNLWLYYPLTHRGLPPTRAYGGAPLQSSPNYVYLRTYESFRPSRHWDLFNIATIVTNRDDLLLEGAAAGLVPTRAGEKFLYSLPVSGYFGDMNFAGVFSPSNKKAYRAQVTTWLKSQDSTHFRHLLWQPRSSDVTTVPETPGMLEVVSQEMGRSNFRARVKVAGGVAGLLFKMSYHPGWRATVDEAPAEISRVSPDMMALTLAPGEHEVAFVFVRARWIWGLWALAWVIFAGLYCWQRISVTPDLARPSQ